MFIYTPLENPMNTGFSPTNKNRYNPITTQKTPYDSPRPVKRRFLFPSNRKGGDRLCTLHPAATGPLNSSCRRGRAQIILTAARPERRRTAAPAVSTARTVVLCQEKVQVKRELFTLIFCFMLHQFPNALILSNISFHIH